MSLFYKKHEDYVCVKGEYQSTLQKNKSLFEMWKYGK